MLVDLFYQLFMMKCERNILIEIKKKHILESDFQTAALIVITVLLFTHPPSAISSSYCFAISEK